MTDKIVLTKKQFERWYLTSEKRLTLDDMWPTLILESQKPELIERWCVIRDDGAFCAIYSDKQSALRDYPTVEYRVILLREVEGGE